MSTNDQQFFDTFTLVIGGLVAIAVGIFILSIFTAGVSQRDARMADPAYQSEVLARIEPFGRARLPGETDAQGAAPASVAAPAPVATVMSGLLVLRNLSTPLLEGDVAAANNANAAAAADPMQQQQQQPHHSAGKAAPLILAIPATHFILACALKISFYSH